ncbi:MAG: S1 RNA-binding domain-containing protein [Candidatus Ryanbacteria bacterium]|nr:S1 RNA-binding domain-containing protein [Candidatus Ryanbacteria bacterium]
MTQDILSTDGIASDKGAFSRMSAEWRIPRVGDVVEGTILRAQGSVIFIDLGFATGIIYGREFQDGRDMLRNKKEGDIIVSKIVDFENEQGYIELSVKEAGREKFWKEANAYVSEKRLLSLKALEANRGGLVFEWNGTKGFLPLSQLSQKHYPRVEGGDKTRIFEELQKLVGEEFGLHIITADPREEKLIFSEKTLEPDGMKERLANYQIGTEYEGEVSGIVEFGVFVKLEEGLEGLVHISEIDWSLVENPSDLYKVGDKVQVKIIGVDADKVSLSIKALKPDPWKELKLEKGDIVEGIVTKLNKYGAFVKLPKQGGISGLSHVSEFESAQKMRDLAEVGKAYPFQIVVYQPESHKLSLAFLGKDGTEKKAE